MNQAPAVSAPSAAAARMRKSRERRRQGETIVSLKLGSSDISDLAALGWMTCSRFATDKKRPLRCAHRADPAGDRVARNPHDDNIGGHPLRAVLRNRGAERK